MDMVTFFKRLIRFLGNRESRATARALSAEAFRNGGWPALVALYKDRLGRMAQRSFGPGALTLGGLATHSGAQEAGTPVDYLQAIRSNFQPVQPYYVSRHDARVNMADSDIKVIAYYLPQFHPFPVNNAVWGQGFTEWTNVTRALPQYAGHYQPHLPADLGFYDLRLPEVMRSQIDLARTYGIDGFCIYYYWFDGVRVMDEPLNSFLQDSSLNFPFSICWANENWTKKWDGLDSEIVLSQDYSREKCIQFIDDVLALLQDPRYIRVHGKPLLAIYRPSLIPDIKNVVQAWRQRAVQAGLPGLWLVNAQTFGVFEPEPMGFDAAVEFPPHKINARIQEIAPPAPLWNSAFQGKVWSYSETVSEAKTREHADYPLYRCVFPSWDNEARRPGNGFSFAGANPPDFGEWLATSASFARETLPPGERFVFVNAWNEWAEGAHLEPDRHFGFAWLDQIASLKNKSITQTLLPYAVPDSSGGSQRQSGGLAVVAHLYYEETWPDIAEAVQRIEQPVDLIITTSSEKIAKVEAMVRGRFPAAEIIASENRGRDIRPFVSLLPLLIARGYRAVLKIHSKKSAHRVDGDLWRRQLLGALVPSGAGVGRYLDALARYPSLGIVAPDHNVLSVQRYIGSNQAWCNALVSQWGESPDWLLQVSPWFPAGSMFWCKPQAFQALLRCASIVQDGFEPELGQTDGTLAHAVERLFGAAALTSGYHLVEAVLATQLGSEHAAKRQEAEAQWVTHWGRTGRKRIVDTPFARPTAVDH